MDWKQAIDKNREALGVVVAGLIAMAGRQRLISPLAAGSEGRAETSGSVQQPDRAEGGGLAQHPHPPLSASPTSPPQGGRLEPGALPRPIYRSILRILRPAESALRRLIVIVAAALAATLARTASRGRLKAARPLPDFSTFTRHGTLPAFPLIDPRKRFGHAGQWGVANHVQPRIGVPGLADPARPAKPDRTFNAAALLRRIEKLQYALHTLPRQARRLNRLMARRTKAGPGPGRLGPIRPGPPPGHRKKSRHEVDDILRECHFLALDCRFKPP